MREEHARWKTCWKKPCIDTSAAKRNTSFKFWFWVKPTHRSAWTGYQVRSCAWTSPPSLLFLLHGSICSWACIWIKSLEPSDFGFCTMTDCYFISFSTHVTSFLFLFIRLLFIHMNISSLSTDFFCFEKYRKRKKQERKKRINLLIEVNFGMICFDTLMLELISN